LSNRRYNSQATLAIEYELYNYETDIFTVTIIDMTIVMISIILGSL